MGHPRGRRLRNLGGAVQGRRRGWLWLFCGCFGQAGRGGERCAQAKYACMHTSNGGPFLQLTLAITKPCPVSMPTPAPILRAKRMASPLQKWSSLQGRTGAGTALRGAGGEGGGKRQAQSLCRMGRQRLLQCHLMCFIRRSPERHMLCASRCHVLLVLLQTHELHRASVATASAPGKGGCVLDTMVQVDVMIVRLHVIVDTVGDLPS
jgi:hypothetical protein